MESGILDFGIRSTVQGIRNPTSDRNPVYKLHSQRFQNPVPEIRNPRRGIQNPGLWNPEDSSRYQESRLHCQRIRNPVFGILNPAAWNPESKTGLDSLTRGDLLSYAGFGQQRTRTNSFNVKIMDNVKANVEKKALKFLPF